MTWGIAKEMTDRLIEFIIKMFEGESVEDQLTKAIKTISLLLAMSLFVNFSMFLANINLRSELKVTEVSLVKVSTLFGGGDSSPVGSFVKVTGESSSQIDIVQDQNDWLVKQLVRATIENTFMKRTLVLVADNNKRLSLNNNALLLKCSP